MRKPVVLDHHWHDSDVSHSLTFKTQIETSEKCPLSQFVFQVLLPSSNTMASFPTEEQKTHEINWYVSVKDRLEALGEGSWRPGHSDDGIPVKMKTPLSSALTRLSNSPAISFTPTRFNGFGSEFIADISLTVGGEDAGNFGHPNIEKILEKSRPSAFGKGEKTVMDLEYRNGREVEAKDIVICPKAKKEAFYELIKTHISESLFVDKPVEIELYKLALYGKEGHFDWHRDTTHGDGHHATVLVALNTEWEGGNLALKYEGKTVDVDMHAVMRDEDVEESDVGEDEESDGGGDEGGDKKPQDKRSSLGFQIIAFYTDIEHKVENITDGTRIVLQFDVHVAGRKPLKHAHADKHKAKDADEDADEGTDEDADADSDEDADDSDEDAGDAEDEDEDRDAYKELPDGSGKPVLDTLRPLFPLSGADVNRDAILDELVVMVKKLHTSESINEVVFPLRHLYRLASIKPEYLKGVDAYLYEGLKKAFAVSLKPIVLIYQTDWDGHWIADNTRAYPFVSVQEDPEGSKKPAKRRKIERKSEIHVPARYELMEISSTEYIEHTGNEAQIGEGRYFGGGVFVTAKGA